jgi:hypothetical protein
VTPEAIASLKRTGCGIKGEFVTGVGKGTLPSVNIELRKSMKVRGRRADGQGARLERGAQKRMQGRDMES